MQAPKTFRCRDGKRHQIIGDGFSVPLATLQQQRAMYTGAGHKVIARDVIFWVAA